MATVEAVLVVPVLLLLLLLIVQVALWYHAATVADAAAQDGALVARAQGATAQDGISRADQLLDEAARSLLVGRQVTATVTPDAATVEVHAHCISLVPFVSLPVHAFAESTREVFRGRLTR